MNFILIQSLDAFEFVKKDLTDFTTTIKHDTETYFNKVTQQEPTTVVESINVIPTRSFDRVQVKYRQKILLFSNDFSFYKLDRSR